MSSEELEKYEYLTGKDSKIKPDVVLKAKFEYSPLDESDKKEGTLKRLKNIEDKSENQQKMIKDKKNNQLGIKSIADTVYEELSPKAKNMLDKLSNQEKIIDYRKFDFRRDNHDFSDYRFLKELFKAISFKNLSIEDAERIQVEFNAALRVLEGYNLRKLEYITKKIIF